MLGGLVQLFYDGLVLRIMSMHMGARARAGACLVLGIMSMHMGARARVGACLVLGIVRVDQQHQQSALMD